MAEDREIIREIWAGRIPICFGLATEEVSTPMAPDPFYLMVPRMTYFPLVTEKVLLVKEFTYFTCSYYATLFSQVRRHFVRCVDPEKHDNEMWLEFEKHPLKWYKNINIIISSLQLNHFELQALPSWSTL